jgi:YidC/Oxa1 family membrane protein insertase
MQQQRNVILFFILSALIFLGWTLWFQPKPAPRKPDAQPEPASVAEKPSSAETWVRLSNTGRAGVVATRLSAISGLGAGLPSIAEAALAAREPWPEKPKPRPEVAQAPRAPLRTFMLGHPSWPIRAKLTSQGAAIEQLLLNRYEKANAFGQPVPETMELIPDNPENPNLSYLLYLYRDPGKEHPLPDLGETNWQVDDKGTVHQTADDMADVISQVVFYTDVPQQGLRISKIFRLAPGQYHVQLEVRIENRKADPQVVRYQIAGAIGLPIEGEWYTSIFRNAMIGWLDGRNNARRQMEDAREVSVHAGGNAVERPADANSGFRIQWAGTTIQYFASVLVVDNEQENQSFLERARATIERQPNPKKPFLDDITMRTITVPLKLDATGKPGSTVVHKYLLYNGPLKVRLLSHFRGDMAIDPALVERYEFTLNLNTLTDYHSSSWAGEFASKIFWTDLLIYCTNLMHWLLDALHRFVMPWSYGLCIILLTVIVRGAMFPISRRQALMSIRMQELAPELNKLKEKHKNDPQAMGRAQWELYGRHGVNPLGGCLPLLLQMPVFMGLYYCLQESIHFRLEPLPILGSYWIQNLAAPDMLIPWSERIPVISTPDAQGSFLYLGPFFNLLPVAAVALMMVSTALMTPPPADEQQAMQQKMMKYMMIFFGLMFYKMPAGLCLYFIASSLWGIAERKLLPKKKAALATAGGPAPPSGGARSARARSRGPRSTTNGDGMFQKLKDWWQEVLRQAEKR